MKETKSVPPEPIGHMVRHGALPDFVVVMGIAGSGKSAVGERLAAALGAPFVEADTFHSPYNVERMRQGIGLTDEDRWPWLIAVCNCALAQHRPVIIACSVLKRSYRDLFRDRLGAVRFVFLDGSPKLIAERIGNRRNHFASASLIESQLKALEPPSSDENAIVVDISSLPDGIVASIVASFGFQQPMDI